MIKRSDRIVPDAGHIAVQALSFLASDPERLGRFLAATGLGPADLRAAARDPNFLAGVLDHLAEDESAVLTFAAESGIDPEHIMRARLTLSGPAVERDIP